MEGHCLEPVSRSGFWALPDGLWACHAFAMPYFLEYVTGLSVGRFALEGLDFTNFLSRAEEAVRGLNCLSATLLYSPDSIPVFGNGSVLAAYSRADGWISQEELPEWSAWGTSTQCARACQRSAG